MSVVAALPPPALLAAGFDWLEAILPILFVGFWILSQVFAVFRRLAGGPARPPVIRMPAPPPPAPRGADPRVELEKQIDLFLRQVTGEPPRAALPRPGSRQPPPLQPPPAARRPAAGRAVAVGAAPDAPATERLSPGAERRVGTLGTRSSDVARHVEDAFAHELEHLHSGFDGRELATVEPGRGVPKPRATQHDLVRAACDPATIRQAILLREILERPVDRW